MAEIYTDDDKNLSEVKLTNALISFKEKATMLQNACATGNIDEFDTKFFENFFKNLSKEINLYKCRESILQELSYNLQELGVLLRNYKQLLRCNTLQALDNEDKRGRYFKSS